MHDPAQDPASALAIRTQYRQSQSRAARLRLLVDTGRELTRLTPDAMRQQVLRRACAFVAMDHGLLLEWESDAPVHATAGLGSQDRLDELAALANTSTQEPAWAENVEGRWAQVLSLPLRGSEERPFGLLLLANSSVGSAPDNEDVESLNLLATLLAAHLQNNRLLQTLLHRERSMSELVHRLLSAQEDERKRVAYDLHDGLAQTLAGLHQRLQGFAGRCPPLPERLDHDLQAILDLAQHCVGEGRRLIGGLRPSVLDDFGLFQAVDKEVDRLREAGIQVNWFSRSLSRLPGHVEIALFRIAQEGINNILKHARASSVKLELELHESHVALLLEDDGCGFDSACLPAAAAGQSLGLVAMQERASLLGGRFSCISRPGGGTQLRAIVPLYSHDKACS
ncbi:sensor histidine kinase [uncultured Pseudomonas sp.]|uniref:sensor histidine kinase n=1 Tax=uncultured Pseudomonas sp. TaxID=114707 RepID=UPI0025DB52BE|nr:sensor histidine kinase [uncultured Pseudomonas sp.]